MKAASTQMQTHRRLYTVPSDLQWPERMKTRATTYLKKYDSCTQSILWSFMEALGVENRLVLRAGGAMQGGMMSSMTCGVHTAGLMILGLLVGREKIESGLDDIDAVGRFGVAGSLAATAVPACLRQASVVETILIPILDDRDIPAEGPFPGLIEFERRSFIARLM